MTEATPSSATIPSPWNAFHGDPQLADFLFNRLRWHAKAGHLEASRRPYWQAGKGTTSAALVHNSDPQIFERITGLPYPLGLVLELAAVRKVFEIDAIAAALQPGLDTLNVAAGVLHSWFADPDNCWPQLIEDIAVDQLRRDWLATCELWLAGERNLDWQGLALRIKALMRPAVALRTVQNSVLEMLHKLCPPPPAEDVAAWISLTVGSGVHCKFMVAQHSFGWTASDFAKEVELFQWFTEREQQEPGGKFTNATLRIAQNEWESLPKDLGYIAKEHYFHQHAERAFSPINARLQAMLVAHLRAAPVAVQS